MIRGKFVLLSDDKAHISKSFNGGMYFHSGWGSDAMDSIQNARNLKDFKESIRTFDKTHHAHLAPEEEVVEKTTKLQNNEFPVAGNKNLFWADFSFIKNATDKDITIKCGKSKNVILRAHTSMSMYFDEPDSLSVPDKFRRNYPESKGA